MGTYKQHKHKKLTQQTSEERSKIRSFLLEILRETNPQADDYIVIQNAKGSWTLRATNDEPLKFGNGFETQLDGALAKLIWERNEEFKKWENGKLEI